MRRMLLLTAVMAAATLVGCQGVSPEMAKDADDVQVSVEEADRAFLYSRVDAQRLLELARPSDRPEAPAKLYVYDSATQQLQQIAPDDVPALAAADNGLLAVSIETHGASVNLWNWIEGDVERLELRLDGLSSLPADVEGQGQAVDVVFTAKESALFPFCKDKDYEIYRARLAADADGTGSLLEFAQLTHNDWDDLQPTFSPDGHWVAFVSRQLGPKNVALMDTKGEYLRLLTDSGDAGSYFPVVLPGSEECLYVSEINGISEFFVCGLDGTGHRRASGEDLKQMLFAWDDGTRHTYLMTDIFAQEQDLRLLLDLPRTLDLVDLIMLAEWNSPVLKQYRQKILAAQAETEHNQRERGARLAVSGTHMVDEGIFVGEATQNPFDRAVQGFTRLLFTLSMPLFQGSLNKAIEQRDMWQEVVYSQTYLKRYNELVQKVVSEHANYSEQMAKAAILRKTLDLNRKRRFLCEVRVAVGKELAGKLTEAESYISETEADLTDVLGKAKAARARLCAALGMKDSPSLHVEAAALDWQSIPLTVAPLEELQALAQLNHPDLARLKFLELRAAAIRDMGAPSTRPNMSLDLTYGLGGEHFFSQTVDDFIAAGLSHALPLDKLGIDKAYREQWTHEMMSHRQEREQARLDINADLQEAFAALQHTTERFEATRKWRQVTAEKVRLSRIYGAERVLSPRRPHGVMDQIEAEIDHLNQQLLLTEARAQFVREFADCYYRAGLGRKLIDVLAHKPGAQTGQKRSVWLWRSLEVVGDPDKRDQFLRTCSEQGIGRVYCFVSRVEDAYYLQKHNWEFGYFLDVCRENGIEAYALVGNPHWVEDVSRGEIGGLIRSIVAFNTRAQEGKAGFVGLKLDVEPHALPQWKSKEGRARLVSAYLETIEYVKGVLGNDGAGLRVAADVPYTYLDVPVPQGKGALFATLCDRVDELTLMAYLNTPAGVIEKSLPLLEVAQQHGISLEIGVETAPEQPEGISFSEQSIEDLVVALDAVYKRVVGFESFAGFAIHDYSSLLQLIERSHGR